MTAKEKLASIVGMENADKYVRIVQDMVAVDSQEQVEEKVLTSDV